MLDLLMFHRPSVVTLSKVMPFVISQYFHLITTLVKSQLYNGTIYSGQLNILYDIKIIFRIIVHK